MSANNTTTEVFETDFPEEYYPDKPLTDMEAAQLSEKIDEKVKRNKRSIFKIISHIKALKKYIFDKNVKWYKKSVVVAALIYFISPVDAIPDFTPLMGFLDDIGVIAWTIRFLGREITDYYD